MIGFIGISIALDWIYSIIFQSGSFSSVQWVKFTCFTLLCIILKLFSQCFANKWIFWKLGKWFSFLSHFKLTSWRPLYKFKSGGRWPWTDDSRSQKLPQKSRSLTLDIWLMIGFTCSGSKENSSWTCVDSMFMILYSDDKATQTWMPSIFYKTNIKQENTAGKKFQCAD